MRQNELQEIIIWVNILIKYCSILLTVILYSVRIRFCMEYMNTNIIFMNFKYTYGLEKYIYLCIYLWVVPILFKLSWKHVGIMDITGV